MKKYLFRLLSIAVIGCLLAPLLIYISLKGSPYIGADKPHTLKSLPYLTWTPAEETIDKSGVTKYDRDKSFDGINIYCSTHWAMFYLMDMSGKILHFWFLKTDKETMRHHAELCGNGDLLVVVEEGMLVRLDWNSNVKWVKRMFAHHDLAIAENQDIYVLARKFNMAFIGGLPVPILHDYITILSPDGKLKSEISLFKALRAEIPPGLNRKIYGWMVNPKNLKKMLDLKIKKNLLVLDETPLDILHTNTIELIDRDIKGLCKKGDFLICLRELNLIGILGRKEGRLIWKWGRGILSKPHHPTLLDSGNILVFDNGCDRGYSRVVELDPLTKEVVWEYKSDPPRQFYSESRGSNQRLPNGNTLITESDKGRAFEVTKDGEIVWEFYNPEINNLTKERAAIYRMTRITNPEEYPCLEH